MDTFKRGKRNADEMEMDGSSIASKKAKLGEVAQQTAMKKNVGGYQIVKRWNLSDKLTLSAGYVDGKVVITIGDLLEYYFTPNSENDIVQINGDKFLYILEHWDVIHQAMQGKVPLTLSVPKTSEQDDDCTVMVDKTQDGRFRMEIYYSVLTGKPFAETDLLGYLDSQIVLDKDSFHKLHISRKFIGEHIANLQNSFECYSIMQSEIVQLIKVICSAFPQKKEVPTPEKIATCVEQIVSLDLKKRIIDGYKARCDEKNIRSDFNIYSLFSLCLGQTYSLEKIWNTENVNDNENNENSTQ